jgi:hypothetical protein
METFVLIPEQLSLQLSGKESLQVVTNQTVPRGFRFSPFQVTQKKVMMMCRLQFDCTIDCNQTCH